MRLYHIIFKINTNDIISKGENFIGLSPIDAYSLFQYRHPNGIFIAMYDLDALNNMKGLTVVRENLSKEVDRGANDDLAISRAIYPEDNNDEDDFPF